MPDAIVRDMPKSTGDFFQVRLFLKEKLFASNLGPETALMKPGVPTSTVSTDMWNCRQKARDTGHKVGTSTGKEARE